MIIEHILAREPMIIELSLASGPIIVEHSGPMRVESGTIYKRQEGYSCLGVKPKIRGFERHLEISKL